MQENFGLIFRKLSGAGTREEASELGEGESAFCCCLLKIEGHDGGGYPRLLNALNSEDRGFEGAFFPCDDSI